MADTNSPATAVGGEGGGPPVDLGASTAVVVEKVNAPAATPAPVPAAPAAPVVPAAPVPAVAEKTAPAAPAPVTPPVAKTIGDPPTPKPGEEPAQVVPAEWPDDWRQKMAGTDKKLLARLERMTSPNDVLNSWRAIEQRLSSGELKRALPNNATPEEVKAYRESNGIPDKPEGYDVALGNGFVWGEADKPLLEDFTKHAHADNIPGEVVKSVLGWFTRQQQQTADEVSQRDENERVNGGEALRAEWGNGFKGNLAAARNMFEGQTVTTPDGAAKVPLYDLLMTARADDGRRLGNIPDVIKWAASVSRDLNPFATIVPDSPGGSPIKTAEARMGELNAMMRDKGSAYWRGAQRDNLQEEWRTLHDAIEKSKTRAA